MQKAAQLLHNAASEYGRGVEALNIKALSPAEQKLLAAIVGATAQAVLSKLAEALHAEHAATPQGQQEQNAVGNILKPPLPPIPPRMRDMNAILERSHQARQDAIRDFAGNGDTDPSSPPSSVPNV